MELIQKNPKALILGIMLLFSVIINYNQEKSIKKIKSNLSSCQYEKDNLERKIEDLENELEECQDNLEECENKRRRDYIFN